MLKEIFLKRWVMAVNGLLFLYSIATTFRDALPPETQQKYQLNLFLHRWSLQTWIAIFAVGNFLIVLHGAWLALEERNAKVDALSAKLAEIENAKPRIKLEKVYIEKVSQTYGESRAAAWGTGGAGLGGNATQLPVAQYLDLVRVDSVPFLKARFVNDPAIKSPAAKANDVRATIDYFRCSDNKHLLSLEGRWSRTDQPSAISDLASKDHLLSTAFGIGQKQELDIAYRDVQDGKYYAWNNDNYGYPAFRCPEHLLEGTHFRAEIRLHGEWINDHYTVKFKTSDKGLEIE